MEGALVMLAALMLASFASAGPYQRLRPDGCCADAATSIIDPYFMSTDLFSIKLCKDACVGDEDCAGFTSVNIGPGTRRDCRFLSWSQPVAGTASHPDGFECKCYKKRAPPPTTGPIGSTTSPTTSEPTKEPTTAPTMSIPAPNIVHIVADDLGYFDLGYKNGVTVSPNLDYLATTGVLLTDFYAQPFCSPSRAAMMTGRYSWRQGYHTLGGIFKHPNVDLKMISDVLKETAGYTTALIGKWHLGCIIKEHTPTYRGFDYFFGGWSGGPYDYWTGGDASETCLHGWQTDMVEVVGPNGVFQPPRSHWNGTYLSRVQAQYASNFITNHFSEQTPSPLYLQVSFNSVHSAMCRGCGKLMHAPLETIEIYDNILLEDTDKVFAASVTEMDWAIGNITNTLQTVGAWENTVLVFHSDNGGRNRFSYNNPYRGGKETFWEGGIRVEAFVHSPLLSSNRRGSQWKGLSHVTDLYPTFIEGIAGATMPQDTGPISVDGVNIWPALMTGNPSPRTELVIQTLRPEFQVDDRTQTSVIRVNDLKLIVGFAHRDSTLTWIETDGPQTTINDVPFGMSGGECVGGRCFGPEYANLEIRGSDPSFVVPSCSSGCLYNLTSDPTESTDVSFDPRYSAVLEGMKARLVEAARNGLGSESTNTGDTSDARRAYHGTCVETGFRLPGNVDLSEFPTRAPTVATTTSAAPPNTATSFPANRWYRWRTPDGCCMVESNSATVSDTESTASVNLCKNLCELNTTCQGFSISKEATGNTCSFHMFSAGEISGTGGEGEQACRCFTKRSLS